jgi:ABC-type multidrug transport system ATPase subunit
MLSIGKLSVTYGGGVVALDEVSLDIPRGMFGLLGPNGAGKSTLMRTLATLQEPDRGSITFGDIDVLAEPHRLRRVLGYLPQDFGIYPRASARAMLDHLAQLKGITDKRSRRSHVEEILAQTNLSSVAGKALGEFSGGMRQRWGIAQALLGAPALVIVDEPTAGLDPEERNRFHNVLAGLGEHAVVILSTHIVEDVSNLCSSLAIMDRGQIVLQGTLAEVVKSIDGRIWRKAVDVSELDSYRSRFAVIATQHHAGAQTIHVLADAPPGEGFEPAPAGLELAYFAALARHRGRPQAAPPAAAAA